MKLEENKTIRVVYVEPGKVAQVIELGTELEDLQAAVGGNIEPFYPFDEAVAIVCNDEGKYNGMFPNRAVYGENGEMIDIIFGSFFICDCSGESFGSLSEEQIKVYKGKFQNPERFFQVNNKIVAVPYKPIIKDKTNRDREER